MRFIWILLLAPTLSFSQAVLSFSTDPELPVLRMSTLNLAQAVALPDSAFTWALNRFGFTKKWNPDTKDYFYEFDGRFYEVHVVKNSRAIAVGVTSKGKSIPMGIFSEIREELIDCCMTEFTSSVERYEFETPSYDCLVELLKTKSQCLMIFIVMEKL